VAVSTGAGAGRGGEPTGRRCSRLAKGGLPPHQGGAGHGSCRITASLPAWQQRMRAYLLRPMQTLRVRRVYDTERRTLIYVAYSTRLSTASVSGRLREGGVGEWEGLSCIYVPQSLEKK
jgi:hypothetical protein